MMINNLKLFATLYFKVIALKYFHLVEYVPFMSLVLYFRLKQMRVNLLAVGT